MLETTDTLNLYLKLRLTPLLTHMAAPQFLIPSEFVESPDNADNLATASSLQWRGFQSVDVPLSFATLKVTYLRSTAYYTNTIQVQNKEGGAVLYADQGLTIPILNGTLSVGGVGYMQCADADGLYLVMKNNLPTSWSSLTQANQFICFATQATEPLALNSKLNVCVEDLVNGSSQYAKDYNDAIVEIEVVSMDVGATVALKSTAAFVV